MSSGVDHGRGPREAFDGKVELYNGWHSPQFTAPKNSWIGVKYREPTEVRCVKLFQSGLGNHNMATFVDGAVLQRRDGDGVWHDVAEWGAEAAGQLPGWSWVHMPVAHSPSPRFSECTPDSTTSVYRGCCTWPFFSDDQSSLDIAFEGVGDGGNAAGQQLCTPGATVKPGRSCQLVSRRWSATGVMTCEAYTQVSVVMQTDQAEAKFVQELKAASPNRKVTLKFRIEDPNGHFPSGEPNSFNQELQPAHQEKSGMGALVAIPVVAGVLVAFLVCTTSFVLYRRRQRRYAFNKMEDEVDTSHSQGGTTVMGNQAKPLPWETGAGPAGLEAGNPDEEPEFPQEVVLGYKPSAMSNNGLTGPKAPAAGQTK